MKKIYFHRGCVIFKLSDFKGDCTLKGWCLPDWNPMPSYKTIDEAKNAIDKKLGGLGHRGIVPERWLKDKELKQKYIEYTGIIIK